uniref:Putative replication factor a protein 3 n=1 Tax=Rhodnius neglectus TaxID=72488 RepID=A0A0P4VSM8_9HEMI
MEQSAFRILVNGALLPQFQGKTVTIYGEVKSTNPKGDSFEIKSTDNQVITISMRSPLTVPVAGLVEVHGIVKDRSTLICDYYMEFPKEIAETYEADLTNEVVKVIHSVPNIWANSL